MEYIDPETYDVFEFIEPEYRNARPRDHRARPRSGSYGSMLTPGPRRPVVIRPRFQQPPVTRPVGGTRPPQVDGDGEYLAIPKTALAELLPSMGQVWASFLGRPEAPQAVGDDIVDRDNAAMHRDALAVHQQNQTRILALTDLAARAVKLLV